MWRVIAITKEIPFFNESAIIPQLLERGYDYVHLRKLAYSEQMMRELIEAIPAACYSRLVLHDYYPLAQEYGLGGIHMNKRNVDCDIAAFSGRKSRSCHSFNEIMTYKESYDYLFLSPIYDSISKRDYQSQFTDDQLIDARNKGIIDHKIVALGGVTPERFEKLKTYGFGGAAMLTVPWDTKG